MNRNREMKLIIRVDSETLEGLKRAYPGKTEADFREYVERYLRGMARQPKGSAEVKEAKDVYQGIECPRCGNSHLWRRGRIERNGVMVKQYQCKECKKLILEHRDITPCTSP